MAFPTKASPINAPYTRQRLEQAVLDCLTGGFKQAVVDGAAANTEIAVAGIKKGDTLVGVTQFELEEGKVEDVASLTDETTISSDGHIKCVPLTTGSKLIVTWISTA